MARPRAFRLYWIRTAPASRRRGRLIALAPIFSTCLAASAGSVSFAAAQNTAATPASMVAVDARRRVPIPIARLDGPIRIDGVIDEPAWDAIEPLPMAMHSPAFLGQLTERTDIRIAYDEHYLYMAGRMYDSDPAGIRTNTFYRDAYSGDDIVAIVIDSYNDYETAVWFVTNPAGARQDRTVANDGVFSGGTTPMNSDWNAHWDVATSQDAEGWYAEFRIPFSTLRFQVTGDDVEMGFIVYRLIARKNERQTYPAIDPKWGGLAFAKPSQAQRVLLHDVLPTKPVYVTPYALAGVVQSPRLGEPGGIAAWHTASDASREIGADLRYSPTSNLALDLTVNTDFAQVEADSEQVNLTRFPLFFPEKRQFFQERASTFQFSTGGTTDRLFHSRRIGLDDGQIVRILGGARAVGRFGGMDYGLLAMQTASQGGRSSENMAVLRLNQQILNPYSSVGALVTSRLGDNGEDNVAYGLDAVLRPFGDEWITLKWAQTFDQATDEASALEAANVQTRWERIRDDGLSWTGEFSRVGRDYVPRLGFQSRREFRLFGGRLQYKRFQRIESPLRSTALSVGTGHYFRTSDGTAESRFIEPMFNLELKNGKQIQLSTRSSFESVREPFTVAGADVVAGDYWFQDAKARLELPRSGTFRGDFTASAGSFYDGTRFGVGLNPAWNPSKYLELGGGYEVNRIVFGDRDEAATAHLVRMKIQLALDTRLSLNTFAQFSNVADLATFNARFRYNFSEGTDLWIVYNEGITTERDVLDQPRLPLSSGRTIMLKYTHTFVW
jgi:Domain of unknown function (DUF5916)/Carbohydrate family 9 binding domain-like